MIQCGTQCRSHRGLIDAVEFVRNGKLGRIKYVVGTCFKPRKSIGRLDKPLEIPQSVDYDLWCGPAAKVPLYRANLHYDWHWDFNTGNGDMGNQGIHQMDIARWFLGESELSPVIMSIGGRLGYEDAGNTPNTQTVFHGYPQAPLIFETRGLPESKQAQQTWRPMDNYRGSSVGVIVQCEQGHVLVARYDAATAFDNDGNEIMTWEGGGDHFGNFLAAVRSRNSSDLYAEITDGHISSALCHTGGISHRLGETMPANDIKDTVESNPVFAESFQRMAAHLPANEVDIDANTITFGTPLTMDPASERFTDNEQANRLLTREYRQPFVVPDLA